MIENNIERFFTLNPQISIEPPPLPSCKEHIFRGNIQDVFKQATILQSQNPNIYCELIVRLFTADKPSEIDEIGVFCNNQEEKSYISTNFLTFQHHESNAFALDNNEMNSINRNYCNTDDQFNRTIRDEFKE